MRALAAIAALLAAGAARADSIFTETGADLSPRENTEFRLDGYFRARGEGMANLDLDRGLTPSGQALYPVPLADPTGQLLTGADSRLRLDLSAFSPGGGIAVKMRADVFDNLSLGSLPDGFPAGTTSQRAPQNAVRIKRIWGEALTPVGILAAGRMGNQWGLGMLANAGDCLDCDSGDAADRLAFVTPLAGHLWAVAYDISATGPLTDRRNGGPAIDLEPSDDVRSFTFAMLRFKDDLSRERRRKAGKLTVEYGAYLSHRRQDQDVPALYVGSGDGQLGPTQEMERGWSATAIDGWFRLTAPWARIEAEAAVLAATLEQASVVPGALFRQPIESLQIGAAVESDFGAPEDDLGFGLDFGFASGDPAPGFGAFPGVIGTAPKAGDLEGPQADPGRDHRVDNFRFHPDYRVDRILFREIVGTVTDATYLRPHLRWRVARAGPGELQAHLAAVGSWANFASSTPGNARPLGLELDPTLVYSSRDGFDAALEYALLFPLAGLDNPDAGLSAKPAQLMRLRLAYRF